MASVWSFIAWICAPIAATLCILLLSGVVMLERLGQAMHSARLTSPSDSPGSGRVVTFITLVTLVLFAYESVDLQKMRSTQAATSPYQVQMEDRWKMNLWRHQRNWWISLSNITLWIVCWRVSQLIAYYRKRIEQLKMSIKSQ
ncbi:unnamed protein product [Vitrella brassicaformis CCMP3155]|uniref:BAP29/BAP31 transmembrane domain-containing protein n=1 Tax=Vitrella brassicaformis (strain CCMP3155) TaxID=1169540 RepID=A0A0G4EXN9_VITBC|nr:unnamed protein product [Vitrella brassicaformis CCMP3155]|eukprot:CEM03486.1 unnamed protein product [Vitrella brassicaformis CCMP3155]